MRVAPMLWLVLATMSPVLALTGQRDEVDVRCDRFTNKTYVLTKKVSAGGSRIKSNVPSLDLYFGYSCAGATTDCTMNSLTLSTWSESGDWLYQDSHEMVFLADGARIVPMGEVEWSGKVVEHGFYQNTYARCAEKLVTQISILDFEKLINAKTVEGRIGPATFKLSEKDLAKWRVLVQPGFGKRVEKSVR
jgi:hypothetical protein